MTDVFNLEHYFKKISKENRHLYWNPTCSVLWGYYFYFLIGLWLCFEASKPFSTYYKERGYVHVYLFWPIAA